MPRRQRTLKDAAELEGIGLHSGQDVRVRLEPAPPGTGIVFRRTDLEDGPDIPALPGFLSQSALRTVLRSGPAEVGVVEHLLAACQGLRVDNLLVQVDGPELPGLDGSALPWARALQEARIVEQKEERRVLRVAEPLVVRDAGAALFALPPAEGGGELRIRYVPEYPEGVDARPLEVVLEEEAFLEEIAPARTFVRGEQVQALQEAGYGRGANRENTLILGGEEATPASDWRLEREPTRHKILDLLGDLALLGADLEAEILGVRSGHSLNQELVRSLRARLEAEEMAGEGYEAQYDILDVMRLLPHRYPFLLVDRVIHVDGFRRAVGIKNVTVNEPFFPGHWPERPVMPGVLQLEAMAQLSGFLLQRKLEHTGKLVVLAAIDKVRFRGTVEPGDQLRIEVETLRLNRSRGQVQAQAKVGRRTVAEAVLSFAMVDA